MAGEFDPYRNLVRPGFDWQQLRKIAGPEGWQRMCDLALIIHRYAGNWGGVSLANEGEGFLIWWLDWFNSDRQRDIRFAAEINLVEVAGNVPDYQESGVERRRCLDPRHPWRSGPWVIKALDILCHRVLAEAGAADEREALAAAGSAHADELAPQEQEQPETERERRARGRFPKEAWRIASEMQNRIENKTMTLDRLNAMSQREQETMFNTSRTTARVARTAINMRRDIAAKALTEGELEIMPHKVMAERFGADCMAARKVALKT